MVKDFDLFRLSSSKDAVDICSNTLRRYNKDGLPFYRMGKAVFISKKELQFFILQKSEKRSAAELLKMGSRAKQTDTLCRMFSLGEKTQNA